MSDDPLDPYISRGERRSPADDTYIEKVNQVTTENRWDVDKHKPHLEIALMTEDLSERLYTVYIPRTREMPDAVVYNGEYFEVVNTRLDPPQYRQCMVATAYDTPDEKD